MVVILIVQGPNNGDIETDSPNFNGYSKNNGIIINNNNNNNNNNSRGERLSTATNTTSVSFFSSTSSSSLQVDPDNILATTKEEEWITKKKVELTTKKQIETRVKRQVVLEDGKIVEDSGPIVTTNTTEDTEKQEHEQTEHRQIGDDKPGEGWSTGPSSIGVVKEVHENKVKSREETEELLETEDVQHLGDITDEAYFKAIQSQKKDLRLALRQGSSELLSPSPSNGRVLHHSIKNRKTVDTEDTRHLSEVQDDGRLITETAKTVEHQEITDAAEPDDNSDSENEHETYEASSQHYRKTKDQEVVEYVVDGVKIGEKIKYEAENVEGDRVGNADNLKMDSIEWESLSERIRRMRREKQQKLEEAERMDALTKKPLNLDQEEETRKVETSKWLEHHFGSESRSSRSSLDDEDDPGDGSNNKHNKTSTSYINVTMKSAGKVDQKQSQSLSSSPSAQQQTPVKNTYFKGVSEWNSNSRTTTSPPVTNGVLNNSNSNTSYNKTKLQSKLSSSSPSLAAVTSPATVKNVYDVQNASVKKFVSTVADDRSFSPFQPIKEKLHSSSSSYNNNKYYADRTSSPLSNPISELESSPLYASIQQKYNNNDNLNCSSSSHNNSNSNHSYEKTSSSYDKSSSSYVEKSSVPIVNGKLNTTTISEGILRSTSPHTYKIPNGIIKTENNHRPERKSSMVKREYLNKSWSRSERRLTDISDSDVQKEPDPDYTPRLRRKVPSTPDVRSSSQNDTMKKKVHQQTRFDIPLVKRSKPTNRPERKSSIGETFRKLIGKFHTNSSERKKKNRPESASPTSVSSNNGSAVSAKSHHNGYPASYQTFGNVDNHIADNTMINGSGINHNHHTYNNDRMDVGDGIGGRDSPLPPKQAVRYTTSHDESRKYLSSPLTKRRSSMTHGASQTLDRNYHRSKKKQQEEMLRRGSPAQRYYLGEDPYAGSIYGNEKEYDGAKPFRRKYKNGNSTDDEKKSVKSQIISGVHNFLGGRLSKSTSKLSSDAPRERRIPIHYTNRSSQTLPKKLKKQVYINDPSSDQENLHSRRSLHSNSNSMINVSMINNPRSHNFKNGDLIGPQKPARTYLLRSKSFNAQLGPPYFHTNDNNSVGGTTNSFKSNPTLHKLDESPPPLKSPGIVTSISRSTRDLSKSMDDDFHGYDSDYGRMNGGYDTNFSKRTSFLKGLKTRAPELYKTLHEEDKVDTVTTTAPKGIITSTPLKNKNRVEYSNSFHTFRKPTVSFESDRHSPSLLNKSYMNSNSNSLSRRSPDRNGGDLVNKTVTRHGGNDDYSETVRITSKSNDPHRPSVTNTVQSFSKKTLPSKDGRMETIESSETTRVTKSHYKGDSSDEKTKYTPSSKNGVVIEVRNERK